MRIVIPLLAVGLALGLVLAVFVIHEPTPDAGQTADTAETAETQQADTPRDDASDHTGDSTPSNAPPAASGPATADSPEDLTPAPEDDATDATAGAEAEDEAPAPVTPASLRIRTVGAQPEVELGSLDAETGYKLRVGLNVYGAAINAVDLTEYFTSVAEEEHYRLLRRIEAGDFRRFAYAAEAITIGEQTLDLATAQWEVVERGPGEAVFRLIIEDDAGAPVVELRRTYRLDADSYDLQLLQRIINRAGDPLEIAYVQNAQGDLTGDAASYLGDRRQFVVGYVKPSFDPARTRVYTESGFV
ncbi:MAG: YidC/Oxa1 family insertase periplasmic-domain containing protein, partial [Phycisphaeraceae bacterium]